MVRRPGVDIGRLRDRIALQKPTRSADAYGQKVPSYSTAMKRWAQIETLSGDEQLQDRQLQSVATHRITMRYCGVVDATWRVLFAGRTFEILAAFDPESRRRKTILLCKELKKR
jgi:SPP1 family predicted phage head-tail adaptor